MLPSWLRNACPSIPDQEEAAWARDNTWEKKAGEHDPAKALHYSEGKPGVDQIPVEVLLEWGEVFSYGEQKYDRANWLKGNDWHQFEGSALRHIFAFWKGEDIDPESGLPHLSHALWNIGALRYYQIHGLGNDDRPIQEESDEQETK